MSPPESLPGWTERDEVRLLKAVLAMADEPPEDFDPSVSPLDRLRRALADRPGASREEILAKVKDLRRSYEEERRRIGARASSAVFDISHRIWGRPAATRPAPRKGKKSKQSKAKPKPKENGKLTVAKGARRCAHCAATKTPQWRNGPMGPGTLCNACGVRYNKGRLVPEYRPAASPTFVASQHSNNHLQIMELRRRKEKVGGDDDDTAGGSGEFVGSGGVRRELVYQGAEVC